MRRFLLSVLKKYVFNKPPVCINNITATRPLDLGRPKKFYSD